MRISARLLIVLFVLLAVIVIVGIISGAFASLIQWHHIYFNL